MPTNEQYEQAAQVLSKRAVEMRNPVEKMRTMSYLKNLRNSQYRNTGEERAKRLARNCLRAEEKFLIRAIRAYGLYDTLIKQYEWYMYPHKMEELRRKVARGEKICRYQAQELGEYNRRRDEEDRDNEI
jgi:hypothetical protein